MHLSFIKVLPLIFLVSAINIGLRKNRANAQNTVVSSLSEMRCQDKNGYFLVDNQDVLMGRQVLRSIASMGSWGDLIRPNKPVLAGCSLTPTSSKTEFRSLSLAFGLNNDSKHAKAERPTVRFSIYIDGEFYDSVDLRPESLIRTTIDIERARSISFEAECFSDKSCPNVLFTEDLLTQ